MSDDEKTERLRFVFDNWRRFKLELRQRWWRETDYSKHPENCSDELWQAMQEAVQ